MGNGKDMKKNRFDRIVITQPREIRIDSYQFKVVLFFRCVIIFNPKCCFVLCCCCVGSCSSRMIGPNRRKGGSLLERGGGKGESISPSPFFFFWKIRRAANLKSKKSCCGFVPINILRLRLMRRNTGTKVLLTRPNSHLYRCWPQLQVPIDNIAPVVCFLLRTVFFSYLFCPL